MPTDVTILCVSDTVVPELYDRFDPQPFGPVDLILSCGDLPPEYLSFLATAFHAPLYYVRGNHDIRYDSKQPKGCVDAHNRIIAYGALRILGLAGSRWYNGGPNQYTESQMRRLVWRLHPKIWWQRGLDIVIAHAPPRFINDAEDLCHRGFKSYRRLIRWHQPDYFLHGHIHGSFSDDKQRVSTHGRTQVINCYGYYLLRVAHG